LCCLLLVCIIAGQAVGCFPDPPPPSCPVCYKWSESEQKCKFNCKWEKCETCEPDGCRDAYADDPNMFCCNGAGCSIPACHECVDGQCKVCGNRENEFCCDGECCEECHECVEDHCISCAGLGKVCCDGVCHEPCDEEDDETTCSSANNSPCIKCVGILGGCDSYITRRYTNALTYDCWGGCPGDCDDVQGPVCYRIYKCKEHNPGNYFAECSAWGEMPRPLDCYPTLMPWWCYYCEVNWFDIVYTHEAPSKRCQ